MSKQDKLPYEDTTVGANALVEVQKILAKFGCQSFGHMMNYERGELIVQFKYRDIPIAVRASFHGYAASWLKRHPYNSSRHRITRQKHEEKARDIATRAVFSIVRDWIKGQVTAIECGVLSFEGAFLGQIMLPTGQSVFEKLTHEGVIPQSQEATVVPMIGVKRP